MIKGENMQIIKVWFVKLRIFCLQKRKLLSIDNHAKLDYLKEILNEYLRFEELQKLTKGD